MMALINGTLSRKDIEVELSPELIHLQRGQKPLKHTTSLLLKNSTGEMWAVVILYLLHKAFSKQIISSIGSWPQHSKCSALSINVIVNAPFKKNV